MGNREYYEKMGWGLGGQANKYKLEISDERPKTSVIISF